MRIWSSLCQHHQPQRIHVGHRENGTQRLQLPKKVLDLQCRSKVLLFFFLITSSGHLYSWDIITHNDPVHSSLGTWVSSTPASLKEDSKSASDWITWSPEFEGVSHTLCVENLRAQRSQRSSSSNELEALGGKWLLLSSTAGWWPVRTKATVLWLPVLSPLKPSYSGEEAGQRGKTDGGQLPSWWQVWCWETLFFVVQSVSCVQLFATPWTIATQAPLSFTVSQNLLKFMSTELVMLLNHLILCHPLLLLPSLFPSIKVSSKESALPIRWPKYWSFSFSINPPNEYSGLISFRIDLIWSPCVFSSTTAWKHQFFSAQPTLWSTSHNPTWLLAKP